MEETFSVGERVLIHNTKNTYCANDGVKAWIGTDVEATITGIYSTTISFASDDGVSCCHLKGQMREDGKLVVNKLGNQTKNMRLTHEQEKFLSKELQAEIKAGYRNNDLTLTELGKQVALEALLGTSKVGNDKFADMASEVVKEQEKKN